MVKRNRAFPPILGLDHEFESEYVQDSFAKKDKESSSSARARACDPKDYTEAS
jgi:hypothetical protein